MSDISSLSLEEQQRALINLIYDNESLGLNLKKSEESLLLFVKIFSVSLSYLAQKTQDNVDYAFDVYSEDDGPYRAIVQNEVNWFRRRLHLLYEAFEVDFQKDNPLHKENSKSLQNICDLFMSEEGFNMSISIDEHSIKIRCTVNRTKK